MARLVWDGAAGPPDQVYRKIVRRVPGVGEAVHGKATVIGAKASAKLAPHNANSDRTREPGESRSYISVERGDIVDSFVQLNDGDGGAFQIEADLAILRGAAFG